MPKFTIVERLVERREVEAESAQEALDSWLIGGVAGEPSVEVQERWVEDVTGTHCETEDS